MALASDSCNCLKKLNSLFMLLSLVWLTVSLPVVTRAQDFRTQWEQAQGMTTEENGNPLAGTTEEKAPSSINLSEFLHEGSQLRHPRPAPLLHQAGSYASRYQAYHGELLVPPPNR